ncbi:MAG: hypothetical protein AB1847_03845 [bacterium]
MSHSSTVLKSKSHSGHAIKFRKTLLDSVVWASIIGGAFLGNNIYGGCGAIIGSIIGGGIGFIYVNKGSRS